MEFFNGVLMGLTALLASLASLAVYRRLPASWLCDYGETPEERHRAAQRCPGWKKAVPLMWIGALVLLRTARRMELPGGLLLGAAFFILVPAALSDCDYRIIPDQAPGALLAAGAVYCTARPAAFFRTYFCGALLALLLMIISAALGRLAARQEGIGAGDVKLVTACGACLGAAYGGDWTAAVLFFYALSVLSAACWFALLLLLRRTAYGDGQPMAPWIAAAALLCLASAPGL